VAIRAIEADEASRRPAAEHWIENRPSAGWLPHVDWRELWARRELVLFLALRDLKLRYTQAVLGVAWVLIQPLAAAAIFYGVFARVLAVPSDGIPYFVFVYVGLALWAYLSQAVEAASESLAGHSPLVTKVYFPRLVAPIAAALPGLVDLAIASVVLAGLIVAYGVTPSWAVVTLPWWILAAVLLVIAMGVWLSALNAQYRDVRYGMSFLLQIWFFASPIAYSSSAIDGTWQYVYAVNPLVAVLDGMRWAALDGPAPGAECLVSAAVAALLLATGVIYFRRIERRLADVI
jgi:lipopolysaccharide transport system permease protein